ncbi:tetratricopeptide repeat protein [Catelliglobosispora koreensis]|uniref:tetratricopeptide repeat protein n=1 Tax=Catelliglobosispora koreensis TaxID=129052 RepID=UPI000685D5EF|nr:tetratricopeptide repeat protein [Catelliglobosispora koreensis]
MRWCERRRLLLIVAGLAAGVTVAGSLIWRPDTTPAPARPGDPGVALEAAGAKLRERLTRLPTDAGGWASLGMVHVQLARVTDGASHYPLAQQAFDKSLSARPHGNEPALTGLSALAAAKHDFAAAASYAENALAADGFSAAAAGALADAYIELGRYDEGFAAVQKMADLRPDTASYARASYSFELRGDTVRARELMAKATQTAEDPSELVFALQHEADLAVAAHDLPAAQALLDRASQLYGQYVPVLYGRAKLAAAQANLPEAITLMRDVTTRQPLPGYVSYLSGLLTASGDRDAAAQAHTLMRAAGQLSGPDTDRVLFEAEHGDPAAAVAMGRQLYAQRPSIAVADALAWALHHAGQDAEAATHAGLALRLGTKDPLMIYHRAVIFKALGRTAEAQAGLREALTLNPAFSPVHAPAARAALAELGGAA